MGIPGWTDSRKYFKLPDPDKPEIRNPKQIQMTQKTENKYFPLVTKDAYKAHMHLFSYDYFICFHKTPLTVKIKNRFQADFFP